MDVERRLSFGSAAELYDRARPAYPEAPVEDVVAFTGLAAGDDAVEVGVAEDRRDDRRDELPQVASMTDGAAGTLALDYVTSLTLARRA